MRSFFKILLASFLAMFLFTIILFFFLFTMVGMLAHRGTPDIPSRSVLVLDLGQHYAEQVKENPLGILSESNKDVPGLYDVIRLLHKAETDKHIAGIYIIANDNANGFAASMEIRSALVEFKKSGKFILAHGDAISQRAYGIASAADKVYLNPQGRLQWVGYSIQYFFLKGTLEKLEIEPQIFYAGKFKSATEIFRTDRMTPENQLQTSVWLNDLYNDFLLKTAEARKIDTATLHRLANEGSIQNAVNAKASKLIDDLKYDDEIKDEIKNNLHIGKYDPLSFVSINTYYEAGKLEKKRGERIALIYAEGDIIDGKSEQGTIGSETYRYLIRQARLDQSIKAIVFRVNSGGGSSMASENIWRELALAKKEKPVVVSFGDVAASGGYYISCAADSIFAQPTTITGSIGVFGIIPNMEKFFKDKLGVTFDGVKTGPYGDIGSAARPMTESEKQIIKKEIEEIYVQFKQRVADGRKLDTAYVDSIAQGRVWSGNQALKLGLIDKFGGIDDAVRCAARLAHLTRYQLREYPEPENFFDKLMGKNGPMDYNSKLKQEIGEENYKIYQEIKRVKELTNSTQARLPFSFVIQ